MSYHNKPGLNRIFPESVHDCSALHVCSFILSILHQAGRVEQRACGPLEGIFSVSAFIVSVIYLSRPATKRLKKRRCVGGRFKESSRITLHACTWRPLFLTCGGQPLRRPRAPRSLLLADKMWEDKPVRNSSLAKLFPAPERRISAYRGSLLRGTQQCGAE